MAEILVTKRTIAILLLFLVLVVIIIFIVHVMKVKKTPGNGGKIVIHGTYVVTVGDKTDSNFSFGSGSDKCFYINGMESPKLILKRGVYYEFKNESDEPIYFSTHILGGHGAPQSLAKTAPKDFKGHANGIIYFMITDDLPDKFYYQSGRTQGMGGIVELRP